MFGFTTNWFESFVRYRLKGVKKNQVGCHWNPIQWQELPAVRSYPFF